MHYDPNWMSGLRSKGIKVKRISTIKRCNHGTPSPFSYIIESKEAVSFGGKGMRELSTQVKL